MIPCQKHPGRTGSDKNKHKRCGRSQKGHAIDFPFRPDLWRRIEKGRGLVVQHDVIDGFGFGMDLDPALDDLVEIEVRGGRDVVMHQAGNADTAQKGKLGKTAGHALGPPGRGRHRHPGR